ncbi:MAG: ankyrin repeat domain-containing protein [Gammaproteobacteria bacterium]|nr:ankyrin repeat domain-containing protein [Gammaproteobacteria bacterium]
MKATEISKNESGASDGKAVLAKAPLFALPDEMLLEIAGYTRSFREFIFFFSTSRFFRTRGERANNIHATLQYYFPLYYKDHKAEYASLSHSLSYYLKEADEKHYFTHFHHFSSLGSVEEKNLDVRFQCIHLFASAYRGEEIRFFNALYSLMKLTNFSAYKILYHYRDQCGYTVCQRLHQSIEEKDGKDRIHYQSIFDRLFKMISGDTSIYLDLSTLCRKTQINDLSGKKVDGNIVETVIQSNRCDLICYFLQERIIHKKNIEHDFWQAVNSGSAEVITCLLNSVDHDKALRIIKSRDLNGNTCFHHVMKMGLGAALGVLIERAANNQVEMLKVRNSNQKTAFEELDCNAPFLIAFFLDLMFKNWLEIKTDNECALSVLFLAVKYGYSNFISSLSKIDAELKSIFLTGKFTYDKTLLHVAAEHGHLEVVRVLHEALDHDEWIVLLMKKNYYGETALHMAAYSSHLQIFYALCGLAAEHQGELLGIKNNDGDTVKEILTEPIFDKVLSDEEKNPLEKLFVKHVKNSMRYWNPKNSRKFQALEKIERTLEGAEWLSTGEQENLFRNVTAIALIRRARFCSPVSSHTRSGQACVSLLNSAAYQDVRKRIYPRLQFSGGKNITYSEIDQLSREYLGQTRYTFFSKFKEEAYVALGISDKKRVQEKTLSSFTRSRK